MESHVLGGKEPKCDDLVSLWGLLVFLAYTIRLGVGRGQSQLGSQLPQDCHEYTLLHWRTLPHGCSSAVLSGVFDPKPHLPPQTHRFQEPESPQYIPYAGLLPGLPGGTSVRPDLLVTLSRKLDE